MKYAMRQTREGRVELIDVSPPKPDEDGLASIMARVRWRTALIWYMRTLAWVWIGKGLFEWAIILGAIPGRGDFSRMTPPLQAAIVVFACLDFLAAVGLWLAAPWGGAVWLLCSVVEAVSPFLVPNTTAIGYFGALLNVALMAGYFVLSWRMVRERD